MTGLLDAWLDLDRTSAPLFGEVRSRAAGVARAADAARVGGLATQVVSHADAGATAAERELAGLAGVFAAETRSLVELLTGAPCVVTPSMLGSGPAALVAGFAGGPGHDYVADLVADAAVDERQPSEVAERAPVVNTIPLSVAAGLRAEFGDEVGDELLAMVCHARGHAVQLHGPDVPDEALMARVSWKKDPMGRTDAKNSWRRDPDGTVTTKHGIGHIAGKFTTVEAMIKPLKALLAHTGGTLDGLHDYLTDQADAGRVRIFVPADVAGLEPGDATGFRGSGTGTTLTARHWRSARGDAMQTGGGPMPIVRTDQIAEGEDPGAAMIFRRTDLGTWALVTCYPTEVADEKFIRLRSTTS
ncbi:hypothetical protein C1I92_12365 [Jiangella anatolica]|uniref:Uncharacterized protein n=1 Tax=Jiangella anatolica TaxID=2670374 RepID=A0A2W2BU50_9ACTN|nr:hypothetical protein C1I92_12365 [Jiangella anatolica]